MFSIWFNALMKGLFDAHKKDALPPDEQTDILRERASGSKICLTRSLAKHGNN